ncbi:unnamed protein product [Trifolium pratense]|uniref:Uncharacterized protein n=1 Tax=Trifolium pratense TaxID=57577 RepID=A0ACB0J8Z4_TRIPR|nr:unnamed protein product [Trifolium pratense]
MAEIGKLLACVIIILLLFLVATNIEARKSSRCFSDSDCMNMFCRRPKIQKCMYISIPMQMCFASVLKRLLCANMILFRVIPKIYCTQKLNNLIFFLISRIL